MATASSQAVRSFEEEVRALRERESAPPPSADAPRVPDIRKIDALENWLRACHAEKERDAT